MDESKKTFEDLRRQARASAATRWSRKELVRVALFKGAHQESIVPLLQDCTVRLLAGGEVLLQAGERCEAVFIVLSGRLCWQSESPTNPDIAIEPGDCVGELILREKVVFTSAISALEPTRLLAIDRNTGWRLIRKSREIEANWMPLFAERRRAGASIAAREASTASPPRNTANTEHLGLHNRSWMESMLPRQIAHSRAVNEPVALLLIEIDRFADHVARLGDAAGDQAYQAVARAIVSNVRPTDAVVCYGAAQLAVVLLASNANNACIVGERARKAVSRSGAFPSDQNAPHSLTLSVGVTEFQSSTDAPAFLAAAEAALQLARASGGDRLAMQ